MDTVTVTIDGRPLTIEKGKTILQAAIENGVSVPYYCYHPGIGIDGSCRVCLVKIEKMPKLQTSCSTLCAEGMVVDTVSAEVQAARAGIFEFLLANHPLDCPVCDKGGECPLQDFSYAFGPDESRMEFPRRTFDGEGVKADVDFGPTLMLNRNRCIMCTRCARFMRDIDGDAQINVVDRGVGSEIATFQDQGVHSILSGNLMDVCPVGAITTKEYRFKSRPWDNAAVVDTICTQCAKGCNTTVWLKAKPEWAKGRQLIRVTPRFNPDVNGYWMCDIGRFGYQFVESDGRLRTPRGRDDHEQVKTASWEQVMTWLADRVGSAARVNPAGVRFLVSAHAANEELYLFRRLMERLLPADSAQALWVSWRVTPKHQPGQTRFTVPAIDAPNVNGARALGLVAGAVGEPQAVANVSGLRTAVQNGQVTALYVFDPGPDGSLGDVQWVVEARREGRIPLLVVHGVLESPLANIADFVLPGASFVEKAASYINDAGRLQSTARGISAPGEALEDWQIIVKVAQALGVTFEFESLSHLRQEMAGQLNAVPAFAMLPGLSAAGPQSVGGWLQASNPSERWKWDVMFQDLPPIKGSVDPSSLPPAPRFIPLIPHEEGK